MLKAENINGFDKLTVNADLFRAFLINFFNAWGLEARETIEPISVKYVQSRTGAYLKFDYKMCGRKEWLHIRGAGTWY